ncbi:MarR family winged helix-turn-helix transcriptional regulator [Streptomyces sp. NBC_01340]|uniref:MarR family winged helix-turn-helix transcriptional regulator n=1 Tax=unclassified Streptomyces TaxID=2593676 RepID=UPI00224D7EA1|nr:MULTISPECIES: MarR family winged helix-turn-helix transcriptional regulator [unclassified Streptomyces]MCX4461949.1 MarR family winged helix-turn-helix transcriptional regulator [Streptomyces sp. NBC_01719]MCX4490857.1 MarR family winged helix-turn-helix transcriptional regulator [Streptomyces sp. NBC_01728]MCX4594561.1 MarR family winged helix-turn-helix transcriptional regulator [Streptomyces sp. NBC_01549]WSI36198.1 MarR family winged helix-turn-helix transcriptional regulator [Streptomyc
MPTSRPRRGHGRGRGFSLPPWWTYRPLRRSSGAAPYLGATYDKALAPVGLRATQFSILQQLRAHGEMTITNLADTIAMDRTTMASNLKPLAREGLVTIEPSAADRRARIATITPDGISRRKAALPL